MFFQKIVIKKLFYLFILFSLFVLPCLGQTRSPASIPKGSNQTKKIRETKKFPDSYSPLDKNKTVKVITEELIESTIESSRQRYIKGLICVQRGDTLEAIRNFEFALEGLNKLISYPEIEGDEDFLELSKNILSDYEKYSSKINLNEESGLSMFISKDRLFEESLNAVAETSAVVKKVVTPTEQTGNYVFKLPPPEELTIPLVENEAIDKQIQFLTKGRGSQFVLGWLKRSGKRYKMMSEIAVKEGMPLEIILLSMIESACNPVAVSRKGAVGLWQFMYPTGLDYGLNKRESIWVDERRDPIKSTRAGLRYLRDMYMEFNDWHLTLAAYNWGWGNVRRALRQINLDKPTYWDLRTKKNIAMPNETRNYVPLFLALLKILSNPNEYGINMEAIEYEKEFLYDVLEIKQATNLAAIATAIGVGVQEIRDLNPELLYDITPPDRKYYRLRVPPGSSTFFIENFAKLPLEERQPYLMHNVAKGEDVISVSEKYDVAIDELIELNNLEKQSIALKSGSDIRIPIGGKNYLQSTLVLTTSGLKEKSEAVANDPNYHIVGTGESVYSVAEKYKISTANLRNWNNLSIEEELLKEGSTLIISEKEAENLGKSSTNVKVNLDTVMLKNLNQKQVDSSKMTNNQKKQEATKEYTYKVKSGDNLSKIAERYKCSINDLRKWNNLDNNHNLKAGETLVINASASKASSVNNKSTGSKNKTSKKTLTYTVKKGDNLYNIARKFDVKVAEILKENKNLDADKLQIGQKIKIP